MSKTIMNLKKQTDVGVWCLMNNTTMFNLYRLLSKSDALISEADILILNQLVDQGFSNELRQDGFEPEMFGVLANFAKLSMEINAMEPMLDLDITMPIQHVFEIINTCCDTDFVARYFLSTDTDAMHGLIYVLDKSAKSFMTDVLNKLLPQYEFYLETSEIIFVIKK